MNIYNEINEYELLYNLLKPVYVLLNKVII